MKTRFQIIRERLLLLTPEERQRIRDNIDSICFDTYNYHDGKFCPLAIGLGCNLLPNPTQESVVAARFFPVNALKGVSGEFYHGTEAERRAYVLNTI